MRKTKAFASCATCIALSTLLLLAQGSAETGDALSIQGALTIRVFLHEKEIRKSTREFTVVRLPDEWLISVNFPPSIASLQNMTVYSDHGDTYAILSFNTENITDRFTFPTNSSPATKNDGAQQLVLGVNGKKVKNDQEINVHHQYFPPRDHSYSFLPWLAYCSDYYLKGDSKKYIPLPWINPFDANDANSPTIKEYLTLSKTRPNVTEQLVYFNVGMVPVISGAPMPMSSGNQVSGGAIKWKKAPHPFEKGFTNAVFQTLEITNVSGLTLPRRFGLTRNEPAIVANNSDARLNTVVHIDGVVTNIEFGTGLAARPKLSRAMIYDSRLRDKEQLNTSVRYLSTNGNLLNELQVRRLPSAKKELAAVRHGQIRTIVALVLFIGITILIFKLYQRRRKSILS